MKHTLPNFICVGAQKAGTTSLYDILKSHPNIYMSDVKETKFFQRDNDYIKGLKFYQEEYFSNLNQELIIGEIDPEYLYFNYVSKRIYDSLGKNTKLIFMLRNPVERAYSHYLMSLRRGYETLSFENAIACEYERINNTSNDTEYFSQKNHFSYIDRGLYYKQIEEYLKYFPKENMLFILFEEDFLLKKEETINKILIFLGVESSKVLDINAKSNPATLPKSIFLTNLLNKKSLLKRIIKILLPFPTLRNNIKQKIDQLNQKVLIKRKLDKNFKNDTFEKYFKKDVSKLEQLIDRNLDHWSK